MPAEIKDRKVNWYRSPVEREILTTLNQHSDWRGMLQTLGYLGLLVLTGAAAWYAAGRLPIPIVVLLFYLYGTFFAFMPNAFHEFCHRSVFKTKRLNSFFLGVVSFLSWINPVAFWTSHQEHHKYTLHPPEDSEVVLPIKLPLSYFLKNILFNPWDLYGRFKTLVRVSRRRVEGEWENHIFPESAGALRRSLFTWARFMLAGQVLILAIAIIFGLWQLVVLITLAPFYGGWLFWLCNNTQHVGLQDKVSDFRLCARTIILNPFVSFLYWHMNYHIEHHTYASVPCYNLSKLHNVLKPYLPPSPVGLIETWKGIIAILKKQKLDPTYQFAAQLPPLSKES